MVDRWRRTLLGIVSGKEKRRYSERPIIPTQVQLASDARLDRAVTDGFLLRS